MFRFNLQHIYDKKDKLMMKEEEKTYDKSAILIIYKKEGEPTKLLMGTNTGFIKEYWQIKREAKREWGINLADPDFENWISPIEAYPSEAEAEEAAREHFRAHAARIEELMLSSDKFKHYVPVSCYNLQRLPTTDNTYHYISRLCIAHGSRLNIPKGSVESIDGGCYIKAAKRELLEETGLKFGFYDFSYVDSFSLKAIYRKNKYNNKLHIFKYIIKTEEEFNKINERLIEARKERFVDMLNLQFVDVATYDKPCNATTRILLELFAKKM